MFEHEKKETRAYFRRRELDKYNRILDEWYGSARAAREIIPKLPVASTIAENLDRLVSGRIAPGDKKLMDIKSHWEQLVGSQICQIAHPVKMYKDVIYVEVVHNAWLRELQLGSKKLIIENINKFCGEAFCRDIRFTPAGRGK